MQQKHSYHANEEDHKCHVQTTQKVGGSYVCLHEAANGLHVHQTSSDGSLPCANPKGKTVPSARCKTKAERFAANDHCSQLQPPFHPPVGGSPHKSCRQYCDWTKKQMHSKQLKASRSQRSPETWTNFDSCDSWIREFTVRSLRYFRCLRCLRWPWDELFCLFFQPFSSAEIHWQSWIDMPQWARDAQSPNCPGLLTVLIRLCEITLQHQYRFAFSTAKRPYEQLSKNGSRIDESTESIASEKTLFQHQGEFQVKCGFPQNLSDLLMSAHGFIDLSRMCSFPCPSIVYPSVRLFTNQSSWQAVEFCLYLFVHNMYIYICVYICYITYKHIYVYLIYLLYFFSFMFISFIFLFGLLFYSLVSFFSLLSFLSFCFFIFLSFCVLFFCLFLFFQFFSFFSFLFFTYH